MTDFERFPLDDWTGLVAALERFGGNGSLDQTDTEITIRTGSAHVTVARDGTVATGMPLHDFETTVDALYIDFEQGRIQIRDETRDLSYEFRRP